MYSLNNKNGNNCSILLVIIYYICFFSLFLRNPGQKAEVSLSLSEAVLALKESGEEEIPKQHRLDVTTVTTQILGVFSHVTRKFDAVFMFERSIPDSRVLMNI